MFVLVEMVDTVRIPPWQFERKLNDSIAEELNKKLANKVVYNVGLCICLFDITKLEDAYVFPGDGASHTKGHCPQVGSSRSRILLMPASSPPSDTQDSSAKMAAILPKGGPPERYALLWVYALQRKHRYFSGHWAWWIPEQQAQGQQSVLERVPGKGRPQHQSQRSSLWPCHQAS
ncbi:PREDICTED: DNA-directed RNA polymerase III subunit RPC8 isoform X1 [Hipposideros armiger]|uniref:DNA-directed RNA polymerase subunit n=1 Tax=Hipposideros armiger TaxID=186990 RepID=A0A8B7SRQ4_HIPAR|nr:PREDICTED: DNA-directed RNA polymerase III subunit RPC8 isoform X1 [Hipposideros armiger]XP_019516096.1 PREDICTED: DNA-directed RNA polymerase III subunit RPC8 isoform X1 [Hipposideros armiger]